MRKLFGKTLVCTAFIALQLTAPVKNLHAGPFIDWLLGRPIITYPAQPTVATAAPVLAPTSVTAAAYPTTVGYPGASANPVTTVNYATAATCPCPVTTNYAPATTCAAPCSVPTTTAYAPAVVAQPMQYATPTVVGYAPAYRSSWYRVPITYYRPVTAYTGVAAQPVTVMQPCNTQTYQVQRRPFLFNRPWLPATTAPYAAYAPVLTQPAYAAVTAPVVTAQPNCACGNAAAVAPSLSTMPATGIPSTTVPSTVTPSAHIPSSSDTPPGSSSSVPADQAPALQQFEIVATNSKLCFTFFARHDQLGEHTTVVAEQRQ